MKLVGAQAVEAVVRRHLRDGGFTLSKPRTHGETGCDLIATKGGMRFFIEVIGFQSKGPTRSKEFYECFFRTISRDKGKHGDRLVMALPTRFANGMAKRKQQYGIAWDKIGKAFPNLDLWYVDTEAGDIVKRGWTHCTLSSQRYKITAEKAKKDWNPKPGTIGFCVKQLLQHDPTYPEIRTEVLAQFPRSRFNKQHYAWYKNRWNRDKKEC